MPTPVLSLLPLSSFHVVESPVCVKMVLQSRCHRRDLQTGGKITTTNLHRRLRVVGRVNLLIGNQIPIARPHKIKSFHNPATTLLPG